MDDDEHDKNLVEKTIETVKHLAHIASDAAKHAMEPEPLKPGDEVVMMPTTDNGLLGPPSTPQFMVIHHSKKFSAKKVAKKAAKKAAKKSAEKDTAKKPAKKVKAKSAVKKTTAKKVAKKKKAKKSRR